MRKLAYFIAAVVGLSACSNDQATETKEVAAAEKAIVVPFIDDTFDPKEDSISYSDFFLVVADTCANYYELNHNMFRISKAATLAIDTQERTYDPKKNTVVLTDSAEDEIYRGEFFPRRYSGEFLSMEPLNSIKRTSTDKYFALVGGIFEDKTKADSLAKILITKEPKTFVLKATMYMGCMH